MAASLISNPKPLQHDYNTETGDAKHYQPTGGVIGRVFDPTSAVVRQALAVVSHLLIPYLFRFSKVLPANPSAIKPTAPRASIRISP